MFLIFYVLHNAVSALPRRTGARIAPVSQGDDKNMSVREGYAIVVHGGAGSPRAYADGCERAARRILSAWSMAA